MICVYKPPKGKIKNTIEFLKGIINRKDVKDREIWILGDLNTDWLKRDNTETVKLLSFCKNNGLTQYIDSITRPNKKGGSCIDLIITNCKFVEQSGVLDDIISDHYTVFSTRKKVREFKEMCWRTVRDYSKFNELNFTTLVINSDWSTYDISLDPDIQWHIFKSIILNILAVMCPYKRVFTRKTQPLWSTPDIYRLIKERKRLLKLYRDTGCYQILKLVHEIRNRVNSQVDKAKGDFIRRKLHQNTRNPKKFWQSINSLIKDKVELDISNIVFRDPDTHDFIQKDNVPDFLNKYFAEISTRTRGEDNLIDRNVMPNVDQNKYEGIEFEPVTGDTVLGYIDDIDVNMASCVEGINMKICKILVKSNSDKIAKLFSNSLFLGIFPREWACSRVTLLPKTGDYSNPGNWRPISQTCIFAKILERIIHKNFLHYLLDNKILSDYQFVFLPNRSTHEAVFEVTKSMYSAINTRKFMGLIFLNVAKAFNCIHHDRLYNKMYNIGCSEMFIKWMRSYLNRTQIISIGDKLSNEISVLSGIAQGTVLGPLIFVFYINDIIQVITKAKISMFADDCILYLEGNEFNSMHRKLQSELDVFIGWCQKNGLKVNSSKTKAMIVSTNNRLKTFKNTPKFIIMGKPLDYVVQYNYLGIILDNQMSLQPLVKNIKKRINIKMFALRKLRKYLDCKSAILVYKQTILPIFDYAGFLLISLNDGEKHDLQVIQNDALRYCKNVQIIDKVSIAKIHDSIGLLSLEQRRQKQLLNLMFIQSIKGKSRLVTNINTRSQTKYVFNVPAKMGSKYQKSPYFLGTRLWNNLDKTTQELPCKFAFKKHIEYLYKKYNPLI